MVYISKDCALLKTDNENYKIINRNCLLTSREYYIIRLLNRNMWYMFFNLEFLVYEQVLDMLGSETPVTHFHFFFKEITNRHKKDTMNIKPTLITYDEQSIKTFNFFFKKYTFTPKTDIIKCVFHIKERNKTENVTQVSTSSSIISLWLLECSFVISLSGLSWPLLLWLLVSSMKCFFNNCFPFSSPIMFCFKLWSYI